MNHLRSADIKQKARELGFQKIGIVPATALTEEGARLHEWLANNFHGAMHYLARDPEKRSDPRLLLPSAQSVICVALNYYQPEPQPDTAKVSRYAWGEDYHDILQEKLKALRAWMLEKSPDLEAKICVDTAPLMDKAWAVRAGLGWLGKHTNVITREFGSWVFLGAMLVSIELEYDNLIEKDHCGKCTACIDACPTDAIVAPYQLDATRCISYGTIELRSEELPDVMREKLEGWLYGCDICQDVCPWSRFSKPTNEARFTPRPDITKLNLQELAEMSQEEFSTRFRGSAIKRAKVSGLRRNAQTLIQIARSKPSEEN
jgi:epoxyqueuosine reductase